MLAFLVMFPGRARNPVHSSYPFVLKFSFVCPAKNIVGSSEVQASDANATGCVYT